MKVITSMKTMLGLSLSAALGISMLGAGFAMAQSVSQPKLSDDAPIIFLKPGQTVTTVSQSGLGPVGSHSAFAVPTHNPFLKPGQAPVAGGTDAP